MNTDLKPSLAEKPSSVAHAFRISLNLTRRVIRRVIELEQLGLGAVRRRPVVRESNVPDSTTFLFSLRMVRRVVHRMIEQAGPIQLRPA